MNTHEIDTFTARLARFADKGHGLDDAEALADKLVRRDREPDDRLVCLECFYLSDQSGKAWDCRNWQAAKVASRARDAQLSAALVWQLQRCDGFKEAKAAVAGNAWKGDEWLKLRYAIRELNQSLRKQRERLPAN